MKRSFKVFAMVLCLIMAMFAFAACNNTPAATPTEAPAATDAPAADAATDAPAADAATEAPEAATEAPAVG